jgi:hypothetical protein
VRGHESFPRGPCRAAACVPGQSTSRPSRTWRGARSAPAARARRGTHSMTIHRREPFRYEPWYLPARQPGHAGGDRGRAHFVTWGESSWERIWISCWMSSISSSALSRSMILIATVFCVRLSYLPRVSRGRARGGGLASAPLVDLAEGALACEGVSVRAAGRRAWRGTHRCGPA